MEVDNPLRNELNIGLILATLYGAFPAFIGIAVAFFNREKIHKHLKIVAYWMPVVFGFPHLVLAVLL